MRLARLSEMSDRPVALKKNFSNFLSKKFGGLKKVLTFAAAIETIATSSLKDLHINK